MGTFSGKPLEKGKGFETRVAHPRPNQIRLPPHPPDIILPSIQSSLSPTNLESGRIIRTLMFFYSDAV